MTHILVVGNDGTPDGFGRINMEINSRLVRRGYRITAASLSYDGLLPPNYEGAPLPYHVAAMGGKPNWPECVIAIANTVQPDIIHVVQDAPYCEIVRNLPLDWSRYGFMATTPVDGVPIFPRWIEMMKSADAALTISQFGVDAYRDEGAAVNLCRPAADANKFFRLNSDERLALRAKLGLGAEHFIFGAFCQNQGRKSIPLMLRAFFRFAVDKPHARVFLDMEAASPAGWDIETLCIQQKWERSKIIFRADALRAGVTEMNQRYNLLDVHAVISHREGFGIPLVESQACGVATMALDYCSGPEIVANNCGVMVKSIDYTSPGTWGGAEDKFVDIDDMADKLRWLHDHPAERAAIAERGMAESRRHTWDMAADAVQAAIEQVVEKRKAIPPANVPQHAITPPPMPIEPVVEVVPLTIMPMPQWGSYAAAQAVETVKSVVQADGINANAGRIFDAPELFEG